jgi:hypothetical protein
MKKPSSIVVPFILVENYWYRTRCRILYVEFFANCRERIFYIPKRSRTGRKIEKTQKFVQNPTVYGWECCETNVKNRCETKYNEQMLEGSGLDPCDIYVDLFVRKKHFAPESETNCDWTVKIFFRLFCCLSVFFLLCHRWWSRTVRVQIYCSSSFAITPIRNAELRSDRRLPLATIQANKQISESELCITVLYRTSTVIGAPSSDWNWGCKIHGSHRH